MKIIIHSYIQYYINKIIIKIFMLLPKKLIRDLSIKLDDITSNWVIPNDIWDLIDENKLQEAQDKINKQEKIWSNDPEVTRCNSFITMFYSNDDDDSTIK